MHQGTYLFRDEGAQGDTATLPPSKSFFHDDIDKFLAGGSFLGGCALDSNLAVQMMGELGDSPDLVLA